MLRHVMAPPTERQISCPRVVVIASSTEGIDALARLINQLPAAFPLPVVAHVHGRNWSIGRFTATKWRFPDRVDVIHARDGEKLKAGSFFIVPPGEQLVFNGVGTLGAAADRMSSGVDRLFESAAHWHGSGVIGIVLSGLGIHGTQGLRAIASVDGTRVIQSPYEAAFPAMPTNALIGDDVQYAVMLDQMGNFLANLVANRDSVEVTASVVSTDVARLVLKSQESLTKSLDRSVDDILCLMREELVMDITFVTKQAGEDVVVTHSSSSPDAFRIQGMSLPRHQSLCYQVLYGRLPAVMPDVQALRSTHDIPTLPMPIGAYMATPVWLSDGTLYGMLCCLRANVSQELDHCQYQRLQMAARQIARLVSEAGEK